MNLQRHLMSALTLEEELQLKESEDETALLLFLLLNTNQRSRAAAKWRKPAQVYENTRVNEK